MITGALARGLIVPALLALLLTTGFFVLSDSWMRLATPVPGLVAVAAGAIGFGAGEAARLLRHRHRSA
jgi:hypothetical protein